MSRTIKAMKMFSIIFLGLLLSAGCDKGQPAQAPVQTPPMTGRFLNGILTDSEAEVVSQRVFDGRSGSFQVIRLLRSANQVFDGQVAAVVSRSADFSCIDGSHRLTAVQFFNAQGDLLAEEAPATDHVRVFDPLVADLCNPQRAPDPVEFSSIMDYIEQAGRRPRPAPVGVPRIVPPAARGQ